MSDGSNTPSGGGQSPGSTWSGLLYAAGQRLVPLLVSTGSLLTFVAFAGAVIVWTRLNAVEVAPDQAITAFPRGELVSIGASLLLLFGFFGALAVLGAFLIDRGGRPTQGMAYGLLVLLSAEGIVAIALAADFGTRDWAIAMLLFLFPVAVAGWATALGLFSELSDELHRRSLETLRPEQPDTGLRPKPASGGSPDPDRSFPHEVSQAKPWIALSLYAAVLGLGAATALAVVRLVTNEGIDELDWIVGVGAPAVLFVFAASVAARDSLRASWRGRDEVRRKEEEDNLEHARDEEEVERKAETEAAEEEKRLEERPSEEDRKAEDGLAEARRRTRAKRLREIENRRMARARPLRVSLNWPGITTVFCALLLAAWLPAVQLNETWLGGALTAAALICMWLWRIAIFTRDKVIWFGLAVFLSVPLFGTFMNMARNLDDPQIQPIALIRSSDRPDEAIHGLYVTEAKDRVYFATVATEGCTGTLRENSGRLLWVPKDEVVAMSIGPLQSVQAAAKTSLEMAFALTPAVETPVGDSVSLTPGEERSEEGGLGEEAPLTVQRLENTGPAVRPTFGRGLKLEPEHARPGEVVTLSMNTPIKEGFGSSRSGRNVRVGGTPAKVPVNPTEDAERAEYLLTGEGRLKLDEEAGPYVRTEPGGEMAPEDGQADPDGLFVKLADDSGVVRVMGSEGESGLYVEVKEGRRGATVVSGQEAIFNNRKGAAIEPRLWRQAWNRDEIKFYVPDRGSTGAVTVDCEQLAGEPLLRIERPPEADLSVRPVDGGRALALASDRSSDDGEANVRRWALDGNRLPPIEKGGREGANRIGSRAPLPLDLGAHRVRLTVEDELEEIDTASLYVLRIPSVEELEDGGNSAKHAAKRLQTVLTRFVSDAALAEIWVDVHSGSTAGDRTAADAISLAKSTLRLLLEADPVHDAVSRNEAVPVRIRSFGDRCGIVGDRPQHGIDLFVVTEGVRLLRPAGCAARRFDESEEWSREGLEKIGRQGARD